MKICNACHNVCFIIVLLSEIGIYHSFCANNYHILACPLSTAASFRQQNKLLLERNKSSHIRTKLTKTLNYLIVLLTSLDAIEFSLTILVFYNFLKDFFWDFSRDFLRDFVFKFGFGLVWFSCIPSFNLLLFLELATKFTVVTG